MKTFMAKPENVQRKWYLVDATNMPLGRLASQVADILSEKLDCDVVQVIGSKFVLYKPNPDEPVIKLPRANK